jgi:hypothetical protein
MLPKATKVPKKLPTKANAHRRARKYHRYRARVGRPAGPGRPGNKAGRGRASGPSAVVPRTM